jgi:transposase-like protein
MIDRSGQHHVLINGIARSNFLPRQPLMTGRPSLYTPAIAERILAELSNGRPLESICRDPGMPSSTTVRQWVVEDRDGFAARYTRLKQAGAAGTGRPTTYRADIADRILDQLSEGRTLADVCRDPGMPPPGTVWQWKNENREGFAARYRTAREFGYHALADEILEIIDDARRDWIVRHRFDGTSFTVANPDNIRHARLRIAARQWLLSKALPRHYGKRPDPDAHLPPVDTLAKLMKEIEERNRALAERNEKAGSRSALVDLVEAGDTD